MSALAPSAPSIAQLQTIATPATDYRVMPFGVDPIDSRLGAGGLRAGALHEATARTGSLVDDAATTLFLAGIAAREAAHTSGPVLWASCRGDLYAPGLAQAGLPSANVIHAQAIICAFTTMRRPMRTFLSYNRRDSPEMCGRTSSNSQLGLRRSGSDVHPR